MSRQLRIDWPAVLVVTAAVTCSASMARADCPGQVTSEDYTGLDCRLQQEREEQQRQMREQQERQQQQADEYANPTPTYQGSAGQGTPRQSAPQSNANAATAGADWVEGCSSEANGGMVVYYARSTLRRSGDAVTIWDMFDFKTVQAWDALRVLSTKTQHEYNCRSKRMRALSSTGYAGHMGKGVVVAFDYTPLAWEAVEPGGFFDVCMLKPACATK